MFGKSVLFFYKALLFGIAAYSVIPKAEFKKYLLYGFIFGAIGDVIMVIIFGPILGLIRYYNMGVFSILGIISFWTPISWMFAFMLFFYFLPVRKAFLFPYIVGFSIFGYMVGLVLQQLGLYEYIGNIRYFYPIILIAWFSVAAYTYIRLGNIHLKSSIKGSD